MLFREWVSLCSPGCCGTYCIDQADLKLTKICLPQNTLLNVGIKRVHLHAFDHIVNVYLEY